MTAATTVRALKAQRIERVVIAKGLVHMRHGHDDKALRLIVIASRALDRLRVAK
jgi:hypothetical protein